MNARLNGPAAYRGLARCYDMLNADCDYGAWARYLLSLLEELCAGKCGADVGCGSGRITCLLQRAGRSMTGFDPSPDMLAQAMAYAPAAGCAIPFVQADMQGFRLHGRAGFCVSVNDCVNYIPPDRVERSFRNVAANLCKGGAFLFDVSAPCKLRAMDGQLYFDDGDDVSYFWQNRLEEGALRMSLTFFERRGELYGRFDEEHVQYLHGEDFLRECLAAAGFGEVRALRAFTRLAADGDCDRIQFVAVRK